MYFSENVEKFALLAGLEFLFFWLGSQDSQFSAPKVRKSRHFQHHDKSVLVADLPTSISARKTREYIPLASQSKSKIQIL